MLYINNKDDKSHIKGLPIGINWLSKGKIMKDELVTSIMTKDLYTVDVDDSLRNAQKILKSKRIRHLPVTRGNKLVGILSLTDILRLSFGDTFGTSDFDVDETMVDMLSIEQVMKHKPKVVTTDNSIREVAEILTGGEFHALPVVKRGEIKGIVTTTDVIKFLLQKVYQEV